MHPKIRRAGQIAWALVGMAVLLAILGSIALRLRVIFPPLVLAGAIVFLLNPVVTFLHHHGVPRAGGAALTYLGVILLVAGAGLGLFPIASQQAGELEDDFPEIQARVERWVDDRAEESVGTFYEFTRQDIEDSISNDGATFDEQVQSLRRIGTEVVHVVLILVLAPIIAFYLLVDLPHLRRVTESLIPEGARRETLVVGRRLNRAVGGFFRGQMVVALIVGVLCSIGLGIIGLRFWFLVGMIAGVFNVIPLIGPWVGGIPGLTIALTTGSPLQAVAVVIVMVGVQQVDNHFITPQVMHRTVHLHPAVVVLALLAGGSLGGFLGLLLAVPTTAVIKIIVGHLWRTYILGEPFDQPPTPGPAGPVDAVSESPGNQGDAQPGQAVLRT